jgi:prevent-host-death family protein
MTRVTSTEANRSFSKLLAEVRKGKETEITVRGEVVAKLVPIEKIDLQAQEARRKSWEELMERLRQQPALNLPRISRDELYED